MHAPSSRSPALSRVRGSGGSSGCGAQLMVRLGSRLWALFSPPRCAELFLRALCCRLPPAARLLKPQCAKITPLSMCAHRPAGLRAEVQPTTARSVCALGFFNSLILNCLRFFFSRGVNRRTEARGAYGWGGWGWRNFWLVPIAACIKQKHICF